jgi:protein-tyrosine phosphatase
MLWPTLEADEIVQQLWQGSLPRKGDFVAKHGFDCLVLCAMEYQPAAEEFLGIDVIYAPNDDDPFRAPSRDELAIAVKAAREVADRLQAGQNVLSTCMQGRNRSGLVSALALHFWKGWEGRYCVDLIQQQRPTSLTNRGFVAVLERLEGTPGPARPPRFLLGGTKV